MQCTLLKLPARLFSRRSRRDAIITESHGGYPTNDEEKKKWFDSESNSHSVNNTRTLALPQSTRCPELQDLRRPSSEPRVAESSFAQYRNLSWDAAQVKRHARRCSESQCCAGVLKRVGIKPSASRGRLQRFIRSR